MNAQDPISSLPKVVTRYPKRMGRGHGSGKNKTGGRGTKGQNARGNMRLGFEGGQLPLIKRLPLLRGKGKNISMLKRASKRHITLPVGRLNTLASNTVVDRQLLVKLGLLKHEFDSVKIVAGGTLAVPLTIKIPCSSGAKVQIETPGGTVIQA
jgi:large subunit ribosomal protein L15